MTEYLTKDEYETFVKLQDKFNECLRHCGVEIFAMKYKREPKGDFCDDCEIRDGDKYMVQFETYSCGESDRDTIFVPVMYLYDEGYREYYDKNLEGEARRQKEHKEEEKRQLESARAEEKEVYEREEYERLKTKYEAM